ncbi:MAG: orotate phosphoribosyltransferase [Candidatus Micrarchaeota archaeon]
MKKLEILLHDIGAVKFGDFTLKSGMKSPVYLDLRLLASHPDVLRAAAHEIALLLKSIEFDVIAAVPYAAIPIGTAVSLETGKPLVYSRKEPKDYGTRKAVEGDFRAGQTAVLLDDLVTTAKSKFEAVTPLKAAGLQVRDVVVLIDREQGGGDELAKAGLRLHAVLSLSGMLSTLREDGRITAAQEKTVLEFIRVNRA